MNTLSENHLFVYGTLMSNFNNVHSQLLRARCDYIGKGSFHGYLFDLGYYPGVIFDPKSKYAVHGEIYHLGSNQEMVLEKLDTYEGITDSEVNNEYKRIVIPVLSSKTILPCWVYVLTQKPINSVTITSGSYGQYIEK
ncbi:gamma-glutamylcyclotransferase family protein [Aquimarina pacifica]|uniref:gamma-glutamylcyclotransferase family protein n=1 Tax=Aquimarina pacifica TaxID=1296415 RepID=UPI0004724DB0|nr:gamma-glutamylcyclotransferase family protein [Aquimarina pacifica]